jgi:hypothetical protein
VPLKLAEQSRGQLENVDVRKYRTDLLEPGTDHFNIEKKAKIHGEVLNATGPARVHLQAFGRPMADRSTD